MRPDHRADIDGLRAVAVLAILFFHVGVPGFGGGYVGVDVFFVISGYLITGIVARGIADGSFSIRDFYVRRIRRIFPALFVMLVGVAAIGWFVFLPIDMQGFGDQVMATVGFVANIRAWLQSGYFDGASLTKPLLHTWSLGVEEQFYLFLPLLLAGWAGLGRRLTPLVATLFALSLALALWGVRADPDAAFYLLPSRAWELLAGSLVALAPPPQPRSHVLAEGFAAAGLAAILAAVVGYDSHTPFPGEAALLPVLGSAVLIWIGAGGGRTLTSRILTTRPMVAVGLVSFSLYLWHWPFVVFTHLVVVREFTGRERAVLIAASLIAAGLSWYFVEQPFRRAGAARGETRRVFVAAGAAIAVAVGLAATCLPAGYPDRYTPRMQALFDQIERPAPIFEAVKGHPAYAGFPLPDDGFVAGLGGGPSELAIWGDSHVGMVLPVVHAAITSGRVEAATVFSRGGCPPLVGAYVAYDGDLTCHAHNDAVLAYLKSGPEKRVVLVSRWGVALFGDVAAAGTGEGRPGIAAAPGVMPTLDEARVLLRTRLAATIDALVAAGKEVVVVGPFAEIPFEGKRMTFHAALADTGLTRLSIPIAAYEMRYRETDAVLRAAIGDRPVHLISPRAAQCSGGQCPLYRHGIVYFADNNHMTWPASVELIPALAAVAGEIDLAQR